MRLAEKELASNYYFQSAVLFPAAWTLLGRIMTPDTAAFQCFIPIKGVVPIYFWGKVILIDLE
ncbi:hypothetical protein M4951_10190 [Blastopirellula sp. J2-11]|uniref:hypothetical protein n=1 Tax=Blastopirellula sp. J2-11 TaxID=2943192 RepID=UPI0021C71EFC|nr:hypothetical protein [Blastopirellula sp. J2-11]UUO08667.1 hypothetical protein M4951_10190 [Blastopirellula sp. J2-11]